MVRRVVAGLVLGLIVFAAAAIVSRGMRNPEFLNPDLAPRPGAETTAVTTALRN